MRLVEIIDEEYQGGLRKWFKQKWVNIGKKKKGGGGTVGRKRGQSMITNANDLVEQETLMLLEDDDASYDSDHAIGLMQQHGFTTGLLFMYEKEKM